MKLGLENLVVVLMSGYFALTLSKFPKCEAITAFEPSLHDGSRIEILTMLRNLNVTVVIGGGNRAGRSPFSHVYDSDVGVIFPSRHLPNSAFHSSHSHELSEIEVKRIFEFYKGDPLFQVSLSTNPQS